MNEDGTLKIEETSEIGDKVLFFKCNYCSKEVMKFIYEYCGGEIEILDKKAIIVCSGCKGKLI